MRSTAHTLSTHPQHTHIFPMMMSATRHPSARGLTHHAHHLSPATTGARHLNTPLARRSAAGGTAPPRRWSAAGAARSPRTSRARECRSRSPAG
eukprot:2037394-Rhodomonas_salina.2